MPSTERKRTLRKAILEQLRGVSVTQRDEQSARLRRALSPLLSLPQPLTVALYAPMPHEVDLLPIVAEYPQHRYAFPRCKTERRMEFYHVSDITTQLGRDSRNIPAPIEGLPCINPTTIDIVIVPGVAFTPEGKRLGYGGGYYDTYLPRCPQAQVIALAFPVQMVADLPTEAHDLLIPHIIHL